MNPESPEFYLKMMLPLITLSRQITAETHQQILSILKDGDAQEALDMLMIAMTV